MELLIGKQTFKVASLKKASETWLLYEDNERREGRGGSRRMPTVLVYDDGGNCIARISYNGRVWDNNDKEIVDTAQPEDWYEVELANRTYHDPSQI